MDVNSKDAAIPGIVLAGQDSAPGADYYPVAGSYRLFIDDATGAPKKQDSTGAVTDFGGGGGGGAAYYFTGQTYVGGSASTFFDFDTGGDGIVWENVGSMFDQGGDTTKIVAAVAGYYEVKINDASNIFNEAGQAVYKAQVFHADTSEDTDRGDRAKINLKYDGDASHYINPPHFSTQIYLEVGGYIKFSCQTITPRASEWVILVEVALVR